MTIKPEVQAAIERIEYVTVLGDGADWQTIRAEIMAMDAEIERLNAERSHLIEAMYNNVPAA